MEDQEISSMGLDKDTKESYYFFTGETSKINRNLSFVGIGIIWIFVKFDGEIKIPLEIIWPLKLFVITLSLDLLHYFLGGLLWHIAYRYESFKMKMAPKKISNILLLFYYPKILINFIGYVLLIKYIYCLI